MTVTKTMTKLKQTSLPIYFERAIFLSWYCARGDCKFCYMSTQKAKIKDPRKARRSSESVLAEVFLCRKLGWKIEFLSGGYESYSIDELESLIKKILIVYGEKPWLNMGVVKEEDIVRLKPYIRGVCGAVECINPKIHNIVCPSKPISEIETMFDICARIGVSKSMTIILGIGESGQDIPRLIKFIHKHKISKVTFYRLKPHKGTELENAIEITEDYYLLWIKAVRSEFPKIHITVGSWLGHLDELGSLLKSGADNFTKFPSMRMFGSGHAEKIVSACGKSGRKFYGTLGSLPKINLAELDSMGFMPEELKAIKSKVNEYLDMMKKKKVNPEITHTITHT